MKSTPKALPTLITALCATHLADSAAAAVHVNIFEVGTDVRVEATGTLDLEGRTELQSGPLATPLVMNASRNSAHTTLFITQGNVDAYASLLGPPPIGTIDAALLPSAADASRGSFGFNETTFVVDADYRGGYFTSWMLFEGQSIAGLSLIEGVSFGSLLTPNDLTITISQAQPADVPLPAAAPLLLLGLGGLAALRRKG